MFHAHFEQVGFVQEQAVFFDDLQQLFGPHSADFVDEYGPTDFVNAEKALLVEGCICVTFVEDEIDAEAFDAVVLAPFVGLHKHVDSLFQVELASTAVAKEVLIGVPRSEPQLIFRNKLLQTPEGFLLLLVHVSQVSTSCG